MTRTKNALLAALAGLTLLAAPLEAVVVPGKDGARAKEYRIPALHIPGAQRPLAALEDKAAASQLEQELAEMGVSPLAAMWDATTGRWGSLLPAEPLIPGTGIGNTLRWEDLGVGATPEESVIRQQAWRAFTAYLERYQTQLRLDLSQLGTPNMGVFEQGSIVQIFVPRFVGGVLVRDSALVAVVNHGNLVLLGFDKWGDVNLTPDPALGAEQAQGVVAAHAAPFAFQPTARKARLELVPLSRAAAAVSGIEYRLAWAIAGQLEGDLGNWEGLVDAQSGELLAFEDRNQYSVVKKVIGGVFPVSNDGTPPDGVETTYSFPFLNVVTPDGTTDSTTTGGVLGCGVSAGPTSKQLRTSLAGLYVRIADTCGVVNEKAFADTELPFNLGSGPGTDCVVPAGHSAGDTHAARSGFYELNRQIEAARGYLPTNPWLRAQLPANMNITQTCNAFWDGQAVNFFRDSGSQCRNTGEIAAIFDHEWGHGMDNNGINPNISSPGESIADIHAILRLQDSCAGRGFFKFSQCGGYGDACTACSGVRDLDFARHRCNRPHTLTWITSGFPVALCNPAAPACPGGGGPCTREVHCEGYPTAETAWDMFARDFQAPPFNFDAPTALEIDTRLWYLGSQLVTSMYQCTPPFGGCPATGGYMQVLAADDDNGNIADGTPHMTAIFAAFNRHEVACATPAAVNSGCVGGPTTAPTVTATPRDQGVTLSWAAVPGATSYLIYRGEGVRGCNFGKAKVGQTSALSFVDEGLANGNSYFYSVLPVGANTSCFGRMSACITATPVPGPNARTLPAAAIQVIGGDGDGILDNCETARLTVGVENNGVVPITNVRVLSAVSGTHPLTVPVTPLPATIAASLNPCARASGTIDVSPHGMAFNDTFEVTLTITADQIAPATRTVTFRATGVESDFASVATRTYNFDAGMQGWTVPSGTFNRVETTPGSGNFYLASSSCLDNQCDVARSPVIRLTGTSTLSLTQRYDTEIPTPTPYDRANVGVFTPADGARVAVSPDGGDLYDLPPGAPNGTCGTNAQAGWSADTDADCTPGAAFVASTWTAAALNPGGQFTGRSAQLSVNFGTDPGANGWGFHFDNVVLTNFQEAVPDAQSCTIAPSGGSRPARVGGKARAARR